MRPSNTFRALPFLFVLSAVTLLSCSKDAGDPVITPQPPVTVVDSPARKAWIVSTFAGNGIKGQTDGPDSIASLSYPTYLTVSNTGDVFFCDAVSSVIRKISGGQVSTYAGRNISNPVPAFGNIYGLAVDAQNNIYDVEYSLIRKIVSPAISSIFAGGLRVAVTDGQGESAAFNVISRVVFARDGNFYVPDFDANANTIIRKITPGGLVSTLVLQDNTGIGSGSVANYHLFADSFAMDSIGNMYITADTLGVIKKITPDGKVSVLAGSGRAALIDGIGTQAAFGSISAMVAAADGTLYVVDNNYNAIRQITKDGTVTTIVGLAGSGYKDGDGTVARLYQAFDIAIDKNGVLYVADAGNNRVRKIQYK